jgi:hypothetical protein
VRDTEGCADLAVLRGVACTRSNEFGVSNSMRGVLMRRMLTNGFYWLLIVPLYLMLVALIVVSKYVWKLEIDTGPPEHIRH